MLAYLLGGGQTSVLFKSLVMGDRVAVAAGAHYMGTSLDETRFYVYAVPAPGVSLEALDAAVDKIIKRLATVGVDEADIVTRQDPSRRGGDLRPRQPDAARQLVRRFADHRPVAGRHPGMAGPHRGGRPLPTSPP